MYFIYPQPLFTPAVAENRKGKFRGNVKKSPALND
jgi:hypothetical protein